jgi:cold-inducible RNA-binding protein
MLSNLTVSGSVNWNKAQPTSTGGTMQIYVGNLPPEFTDADLKAMFEVYGRVLAASIGKEKGYGFVEMQKKAEARAAVDALRGKDMQGKPLRAKVLKPGDEFHQQAQTLHGSSNNAGGRQPRGDGGYRGSGAIRRGGQRGS